MCSKVRDGPCSVHRTLTDGSGGAEWPGQQPSGGRRSQAVWAEGLRSALTASVLQQLGLASGRWAVGAEGLGPQLLRFINRTSRSHHGCINSAAQIQTSGRPASRVLGHWVSTWTPQPVLSPHRASDLRLPTHPAQGGLCTTLPHPLPLAANPVKVLCP